jgi:hypothetical protein
VCDRNLMWEVVGLDLSICTGRPVPVISRGALRWWVEERTLNSQEEVGFGRWS